LVWLKSTSRPIAKKADWIIRAYADANDRTGLSRIYSDLKLILQNELKADPLPETTRLFHDLIGV